MAYKDKYKSAIVYDYTTSPKSRPGEKLVGGKPSAQVSHDTGNPGSTAKGNSNYFKSTTKPASSAHTFTDDKEIRIIIPLNEKAWHVQYNKPQDNHLWGDDSNDIALGHELCWGGSIDFEKAYDKYVWLHAYCAKEFGIPLSRIEGHYKLDPERRTDPINAFKRYGKTWAGFMADVKHYFDNWEGQAPKADHHQDEQVHTIRKGDTFWSLAREHETTVKRIQELNPGVDPSKLEIGSKVTVKLIGETPKPEPVKVDPPKPKPPANPYAGKELKSKVDGLNFYNSPRWDKPSGQVQKGWGFPTIVGKLKVENGYQYQVKNSKGHTYYITASDKYVQIVNK